MRKRELRRNMLNHWIKNTFQDFLVEFWHFSNRVIQWYAKNEPLRKKYELIAKIMNPNEKNNELDAKKNEPRHKLKSIY